MTKNKIIGIAGLLIAIFYGYGITTLKNPSTLFIAGTTIFPICVAIGTVIFSLWIMTDDFRHPEKKEYLSLDPKVMKTMGIFTGIFVVYIAVFNKLGFLLSTIGMLLSILFVFNIGKSQRIINLAVGIIFPTLCYGVFAKLFSISLPRGILPF